MSDIETLRKAYEEAGQGHVFQFWEKLSESEKNQLVSQLKSLDSPEELSQIAKDTITKFENEIANSSKKDETSTTKKDDVQPLPESATCSLLDESEQSVKNQQKWYNHGLELIGQNKVGVILLAGGQGTRLGSSAPKGCYDVQLPSHKSLFQLQAERIAKLQQLAAKEGANDVIIPWYIMTSGPTRKPTEDFFKSNNYFGLKQENVIFFEQGVLPCLTTEGKIIMETPSKVAVAPDGNGGIYKALVKGKILDDLKARGIEHVHTYCVDNCLVKVADPVFIGWAASFKSLDIGTKVVRKKHATESVGLIVSKNGRPAVIEYSEIAKELTELPDDSDPSILKFRAANIVNHYYSTKYLSTIPEWPSSNLPFHVAHKKIPYADPNSGETIKPSSPNGIKLEQFVFDVFPTLKFDGPEPQFAMMEVLRSQEFSPLKNAPGSKEDSPETSRAHLLAQSKGWLKAAGAIFPEDPEEDAQCEVEISPLVSYAGEGLEKYKGHKFAKGQHYIH